MRPDRDLQSDFLSWEVLMRDLNWLNFRILIGGTVTNESLCLY